MQKKMLALCAFMGHITKFFLKINFVSAVRSQTEKQTLHIVFFELHYFAQSNLKQISQQITNNCATTKKKKKKANFNHTPISSSFIFFAAFFVFLTEIAVYYDFLSI